MKTERTQRFRRTTVAATALLAATAASAMELDADNPDLKIRWDNTVKFSAAARIGEASAGLLGSANQDDGNYVYAYSAAYLMEQTLKKCGDTLTREKDDVAQAVTKLRRAITTLNNEGRERLMKAFERRTGAKVEVSFIDSDEALWQRMNAQGEVTYTLQPEEITRIELLEP